VADAEQGPVERTRHPRGGEQPRRRADAARELAGVDVMPQHDLRGVLAIRPYRQLWTAFGLSSLGDWLGLLAITSLAAQLAGAEGNTRAANYAIGGVLLLRLLPALILGPIAGALVDRMNRRVIMVLGDIVRGLFFVSIPIVHTLTWLMIATVLIECASLFWLPAKESTIPNLVPRERLEAANQMNLLGTYGTAPIGALLFTLLTLLSGVLGNFFAFFRANPVSFAIYINALTYFVSGLVVLRVRGIPRQVRRADGERESVFRSLIEGWRFVGRERTIRGLVVGIVGAFAAGGIVIGLARTYVESLGAGNPGYGLLVGGVFTGLAVGMLVGPRLLVGFSRRRLFGMAITGVGVGVVLIALVQNIVVVAMLTLFAGGCAGLAWVTGYTLLGLNVEDHVRGRTFSFVQNAVQITLIGVLAAGPLLAGSLGMQTMHLTSTAAITYSGASLTMLLAGGLATAVGVVSFRSMDDRRGISLFRDLAEALRSGPTSPMPGRFVVFEGGEGAGKSTHARRLAEWLEAEGYHVVLTHEPGATTIGRRLRELLLSNDTVGLSARAEALLYAADRAQHVETVVRPALERGDIVISDRYIDSSVAYQAGGRDLKPAEITRVSLWATGGLRPDLTVLLDIPPAVGLARFTDPADRLENEPLDFHERVRAVFREQAMRSPSRYLVLDAREDADELHAEIRDKLAALLPAPAIVEDPPPAVDVLPTATRQGTAR
jgi:dTMP kinase